MNEGKKLLHCPFCGSWKVKLTGKSRGKYSDRSKNYQVICGHCFARGPIVNKNFSEAEWKWNGRYNPADNPDWVVTDNIEYYIKNE